MKLDILKSLKVSALIEPDVCTAKISSLIAKNLQKRNSKTRKKEKQGRLNAESAKLLLQDQKNKNKKTQRGDR